MAAKGYTCLGCGRRFSRRPIEHTCARFDVATHLDGKPPHVRALYRKLIALARSCGPVQVTALKTTIALAAPAIMAHVTAQKSKLVVRLVLPGVHQHRTLRAREEMSLIKLAHEFILAAESDLDADFEALIRQAWELASGSDDAREGVRARK